MSLQRQKAVASLFCRAAQGKRPSTVCPALLQLFSGFPIQACVKTNINRCHCSDKKLLPACFAEQHRGRDQALSVQYCCKWFPYPGFSGLTKSCCHAEQHRLVQYCESGWSLPWCCSAKIPIFAFSLSLQQTVLALFPCAALPKAVVSLFCRAAPGKDKQVVSLSRLV